MVFSPAVSSLSASSGAYKAGSVIQILVTFDADLEVTGSPQLQLATSPDSRLADYIGLASGDSKTMVFSYTVQAGDNSADLDVVSTTALGLNGGTIKSAGVDANITLPAPGTANSLAANANVVIDTTAPAAPSRPDLTDASDSGASSSDNVTAVATPVFTGIAEAYARVTLYDTDGVTPLQTGFAGSDGQWSLTSSALASGVHTVTAKATDAAGNVSAASQGTSLTIDTTAPTVSSINRINAQTQSGSSVEYAVTFNESVTGVDLNDFVFTTTGSAKGTLSSISGSGTTYTVTATALSGDGTLRLDLKNSATGISDVAGNSIAPGYTGGQAYTLDHTGPAIYSVAVPADAVYTAGQQLDFTTTFSEAVTVSTNAGTPRLALTLATGTVYAEYVSGSGSSALVFRYVVVAGNADQDGPSLGGSIQLNGGSIKDAAGNNAVLTLNGVGALTGVLVDAAGPSVASIALHDAATSNATSVQYSVVFDKGVTGVDAGDFILSGQGVVGTVSGVSGSGSTYSVTVDGISGNGTLRLDLKSSGTGIVDGAGNAIVAGYTAGAAYTIDQTAAQTVSVQPPSNDNYGLGQYLTFSVQYDEAVSVMGAPRLGLSLDQGGTVYAEYLSGSGTNALLFRYVVAPGNQDLDGPSLGGSIQLNGGSITDAAGNDALLTLNNVGTLTGVLVDAVGPSVASISRQDAAISNATSVQYSVVFDKGVSGVDASDFILSGQGVVGTVTGISGSGSTYSVTVDGISGDGTLRLDLKPSGTGIVDAAGNAILAGYTAGAAYTIDQTAAQAVNVQVPNNGSYAVGQHLTFSVQYDEAVSVLGTPRLGLTLDQGGTVYANYVSGSGTGTLTFQYLIATGHADANGIAVATTLDLNGGSLKDAAGNDAALTLNNDPALPGVLIDPGSLTPPVVTPVTPPASGGLTLVAAESGGELRGTAFADTFTGSANKDTIYTGGGRDSVDAGAGIDTVVLSGARAQYDISHQADGTFTLRSLVDSDTVVTLKNVERLKFDNQTLAIDSTPTTGRVAELYKLALGRNPEEGGLDFFTTASKQGLTTTQLALSFVSSDEFSARAGQLDNATYVTQLYQSAFNRTPDAEGFAFYLHNLAEQPGSSGQAAVLSSFIDSPEMAIKLAGVVDQGVTLLV